MKLLIAILLIAELILAFALDSTCIFVRDHVRAHTARYYNPTPETKAELDGQKRITELYSLGCFAVAFVSMAGVTFVAAHSWRQKHPAYLALKDEIRVP